MKITECEKCSEIRKMIAERDAVRYSERSLTINDCALQKMIDDGRMELFAGNCFPADFEKHYSTEDHYITSSVFKCKGCGKYYFAGYCVRGLPVLEEYSEGEALNFAKHMDWGYEGTFFEKSK